jgi:hypothetical protein
MEKKKPICGLDSNRHANCLRTPEIPVTRYYPMGPICLASEFRRNSQEFVRVKLRILKKNGGAYSPVFI